MLLVVLAIVCASGCTDAPVQKDVAPMTPEDLVAYLSGAAEFAQDNGKLVALEEFGDKDGSFSDGDLYIYAYDFDGILLAHPYQEDKVGDNRSEWTDVRGLPFVHVASEIAAQGGGFIAYMYPAPEGGVIDEAASESYVVKLGYVTPMDDDWWIGSGLYLSDLVQGGDVGLPPPLSMMVNLVTQGVESAKEDGDEVALSEITAGEGICMDSEGHYLYAYDFNGTLIAHPYLTDMIGENLIDHTGPFGEKDIVMLRDAAAQGGGYVVFGWENPLKDNRKELKIGYVLPVDDRWWLGSGVYLSEIVGESE